jgi:hypothetical protein
MSRRGWRGNAEEDDGRVIASMDVEGMPGYTGFAGAQKTGSPQETLSTRETRRLIAAGMKWALLISAGFALLLILFILFCVRVWLR